VWLDEVALDETALVAIYFLKVDDLGSAEFNFLTLRDPLSTAELKLVFCFLTPPTNLVELVPVFDPLTVNYLLTS
jgi:hypothetical protein